MTLGLDDEDFTAATRAEKRRSRIVFAVVAVVLGGAAGAVYVTTRADERASATQRAGTAWASLQRCVIGAPLATGEDLMWRVHRVEVNRDPVTPGAPGTTGRALTTRWPYRCSVHATALRDALAEYGLDDAPRRRLHAAAQRAQERLANGIIETERDARRPRTYLQELWEAAAAARLASGGPPAGEAAPAPAALLRRSDLVPLVRGASGALAVAASDRAPAASLAVLLGPTPTVGCRFADAAPGFAAARCAPYAAGASLIDPAFLDEETPGASVPPVRAGDGRGAQVLGLAGVAAQPSPFTYRGWVAADGTAYLLDSAGRPLDEAADAGRWRITRVRGGARSSAALTLAPGSSRPDLAGGRVVYLSSSEPGRGPARVGLFARRVGEGAALVGAAVDAGDVFEDSRIVGTCRTNDALAVAVSAPTGVVLAMTNGDGWSARTRVEGRPQSVTVTCGATEAAATWVDDRGARVRQARCTATACRTVAESVPGLTSVFSRRTPWALADLDGRALVLWASGEGGLRMRLAPVGELERTRDAVVYDDAQHEGGLVNNLALFVRRSVAVAVFSDRGPGDEGWRAYALRVAPDGGARPVATE